VATVGIDGAVNAALLAVQILAVRDADVRKKLHEFKESLAEGFRG
jgi:5-(carboxyamino)imidazole ribonucleotide mutase